MIEAQGLSKRYGDKLAVNQLSFQVKPGMVTGFLGPNGAGKSTTMRMILGLDSPTSGRVTVAGKRYQSLPAPLHEVGALLDAKAIHGGRTAYNHLLCLAQSNGIGRKRVDEVLALVGLSEVAKKRSKGFSLGMGQRLGIAGALLGDPAVLMFDEPVNGLDPEGILWIRNLMKGLAAQGRTIFVSSHLMSEMQETAEHLVVIGRGQLIADVSMGEFIARSSGNSVLVRSPQLTEFSAVLANTGATVTPNSDDSITVVGPDCARIGDLAAENGVRLHELSPVRASLEQAFMELTGDAVEYHAGAAPGGDATGATPAQPASAQPASAQSASGTEVSVR